MHPNDIAHHRAYESRMDALRIRNATIRIEGERKRMAREAFVSRHFIVAAILVSTIALLGACAIAAVQQAHYIHQLQVAERV